MGFVLGRWACGGSKKEVANVECGVGFVALG
jgi:hypothetical protein